MASDAEWERIASAVGSTGIEIFRFIVHRALMPDTLPPEIARRTVRELLVLSRLKERRLREAGAAEACDACEAVDRFPEREDIRALGRLSQSLRKGLPDVEGLNLFDIDALAESLP